jgi:hypothetical protein
VFDLILSAQLVFSMGSATVASSIELIVILYK